MKRLFLLFVLFANQIWAEQPLKVVATIAPIYYLAEDIMKGSNHKLTLLVEAGSSPHDAHFKPSMVKNLQNADLVFMIDEHFETFIEKSSRRNKKKNFVKFAAQKKILLLPQRELNIWQYEGDKKGHSQHHHHEHSHPHGKWDYHIWLHTDNAIIMAQVIAQKLGDLDPENQELYNTNLTTLSKKIEDAKREIATKLAPYQEYGFVTFHDAYQYFEKEFKLNGVGTISVEPEQKLNMHRFKKLYQVIKEKGAWCIFAEPQFPADQVNKIANKADIYSGVLDPLGSSVKGEGNKYVLLLQNLSDNMVNCFKQEN